MNIKFSKKQPSEPGAYYYRDGDGETRLVEVFRTEQENQLLYFRDDFGERFAVMDDNSLEWSSQLIPTDKLSDQ